MYKTAGFYRQTGGGTKKFKGWIIAGQGAFPKKKAAGFISGDLSRVD